MTTSTNNLMIAGGDSFSCPPAYAQNIKKVHFSEVTNSDQLIPWEHYGNFDVWADHVAKNQNLQLINTAREGYGNEFIYHSVVDEIFQHKDAVKLVVVMWSNWLRKDIQTQKNLWESSTSSHTSNYKKDYFTSLYALGGFNPDACIDYFVRYSISLSQICKSFNIQLVQSQGPGIIKKIKLDKDDIGNNRRAFFLQKSPHVIPKSREQVVKLFINHYGYQTLKKAKTFIGWPLFREIGGETFEDIIDKNKEKYHLSSNNSHPNSIAHQMYADKIINKIKRIES